MAQFKTAAKLTQARYGTKSRPANSDCTARKQSSLLRWRPRARRCQRRRPQACGIQRTATTKRRSSPTEQRTKPTAIAHLVARRAKPPRPSRHRAASTRGRRANRAASTMASPARRTKWRCWGLSPSHRFLAMVNVTARKTPRASQGCLGIGGMSLVRGIGCLLPDLRRLGRVSGSCHRMPAATGSQSR